MSRAAVLQHIACEPPGLFEDVLNDRVIGIVRVELDEGCPLPDWREVELVVAMGGPMSVNDETAHPWLVEEKRWIAEAVRAGVPFFGVCLGSQLLAASLGGRVFAGPRPEVGVLPVELTPQGRLDPVFGGLPGDLLALQWHGDTFELPPDAILMARSAAYESQGLRVGAAAYGVQFHLEVTESMLAEWAGVPEYVASLDRELGAGGFDSLSSAFAEASDRMARAATELFERFLDHTVGHR